MNEREALEQIRHLSRPGQTARRRESTAVCSRIWVIADQALKANEYLVDTRAVVAGTMSVADFEAKWKEFEANWKEDAEKKQGPIL